MLLPALWIQTSKDCMFSECIEFLFALTFFHTCCSVHQFGVQGWSVGLPIKNKKQQNEICKDIG